MQSLCTMFFNRHFSPDKNCRSIIGVLDYHSSLRDEYGNGDGDGGAFIHPLSRRPPQNTQCVPQVCHRTGVRASKRMVGPPARRGAPTPSREPQRIASLTTGSLVRRVGQSQALAHTHQTVANFMLHPQGSMLGMAYYCAGFAEPSAV